MELWNGKIMGFSYPEFLISLDIFRAGRWYGSKGNGEVVKQCLQFIEEVKRWMEK